MLKKSALALFLLFKLMGAIVAEENIDLSTDYVTKNYTFRGIVVTDMGKFKFTHSFSGFVDGDKLECKWVNDSVFFKSGGVVTIDSKGGKLNMDGIPEQAYSDPAIAIAAATGVSGGSAHLVYNLRKGDVKSIIRWENSKVVKDGDSIIVSALSEDSSSSISAVIKNKFLLSLDSVYDPMLVKENKLEHEITEQELKETLKNMGKEDTKEELDKLRDIMKMAKDSMENLKDKIFTKTTIEIKSLTR